MTNDNWISFKSHLDDFSNPETLSADQHCESLTKHLILGIEKCVPKVTYTQRDIDIPWNSAQIRRILQKKNKAYKCTICEYCCDKESSLEKHVKVVHEQTRHACENCDATFSQRQSLKNHVILVHEGIVPFPCPNCEIGFVTKKRLSRHIQTVHEKTDRKQCSLCDHTFSTSGNLNAHISSIHKKTEVKQE